MLGRVSLELRSGKTSGLTAARGRSRMTPYGADRHTPDDDSDDNDPPKTGSWPAQWRFAYSNRTDEALMPTYGYNLIDVTPKDEADAVPPGTQAQVWLFDYDNKTCTWEKSDTYIRDIVSSMANDPHVAGFYFSNEPDPSACPTAPQQPKDRNALIHSLAPTKYTLIGIDANWRDHFDRYGSMWVGTADYVNYNPYICYEWDTATCDFAWL